MHVSSLNLIFYGTEIISLFSFLSWAFKHSLRASAMCFIDERTFVELERCLRFCFPQFEIFSSKCLQQLSWVIGYEGNRIEKETNMDKIP